MPGIREPLGQGLAEQHRTLPDHNAHGGIGSRWEVDVADRGAGVEAAQAITDAHGGPDTLFNVAGLIHVGRHFDLDFDHTHPPGSSARNHLIRRDPRLATADVMTRLQVTC